MTKFDVIIVGAGAAGMFTAANIALVNPQISVLVLEAASQPLQKVRISGGGRCNLTHHCFDAAILLSHYPRGSKELRGLFHRFQPEHTIAWFAKQGLHTKTEADRRMFPVSDDSNDVIQTLLKTARKGNITLATGVRTQQITKHTDGHFELLTQDPEHGTQTLTSQCLMLATGYSPSGWQFARALGHTVNSPVPSLFPFKVTSSPLKGLQGISLPRVSGQLSFEGDKKSTITAEGAFLITHQGVSGPLIYRLSAWGAPKLSEHQYQATLKLDFLPDWTDEALKAKFLECQETDWAKKQMKNTRFENIPHRLWEQLLVQSGIDIEGRADTTSRKRLQNQLVDSLKRLQLSVNGRSPSKEEFVSCGGVLRKDIDFSSMQSKQCPGLFFAGEIIDIDGLTGGFNFQACWSAGWVAAQSLAQNTFL
ncbi:MAG: NAD(P)/FAD-dependent oxidoreductase [Cyanobacteria bacterium]|nr:NAD(P)/FAD-dependent oxidoreductase [Cyanobacteriota bacterium]